VRPAEALRAHRDDIRRLLDRNPIRNARVFGSVIHGKDVEGSDLDLLVDPLPGTTLFDLGILQIELEELLGVSVDLVTPDDLPAPFRNQVLQEATPV